VTPTEPAAFLAAVRGACAWTGCECMDGAEVECLPHLAERLADAVEALVDLGTGLRAAEPAGFYPEARAWADALVRAGEHIAETVATVLGGTE
jgi:hypothetical protein